MKRLIKILFLIMAPLWAMSQTGLVSGNLNITSIPTNNGNGTFTVIGNFSDPKGQYFAADVTAEHIMWKGNNYFPIEVASANGSELTLTVKDTFSIGFIPTGNAQIGQETGRLKLPGVSTTGDSNPALATPADHSALFNFILQRIDAGIAGVYEGQFVSDTADVTAPVNGDVLIVGDTLLLNNGDRWITYAPGGGSADVFQDTIIQNGHGFFVGTMVGQTAGNGPYFAATSAVPDSFPVAFISQIVDENRFVIQNEGWLDWTHGRALGSDWFLQDDGSFATSPDSNYNIFGFRTFATSRAYFDVPELILSDSASVGSSGGGGSGSTLTGFTYDGNALQIQSSSGNFTVTVNTGTLETSGPITIDGTTYATGTSLQTVLEALATAVNSAGGGSGATVVASNGLFDADGTSDVDVEIGGPLEHNSTITTGSFDFILDGTNNRISQGVAGIRITPNKSNEATREQGAFLRKNTLPGSDAYVTYSPYGLPYNSPLTFDTDYKLRFLSDGTMNWTSTRQVNNGINVSSSLVGSEYVETINLGSDLLQDTRIDQEGFGFLIDNTSGLTASDYQSRFNLDIESGTPFMEYFTSFPAVAAGNETSASFKVQYNEINLSVLDNPNSKVGKVNIQPTQVTIDYEANQILIDDNGIKLTGVTQYASDAAADADSNLPAGGIYKVTGDRSLRIKP